MTFSFVMPLSFKWLLLVFKKCLFPIKTKQNKTKQNKKQQQQKKKKKKTNKTIRLLIEQEDINVLCKL